MYIVYSHVEMYQYEDKKSLIQNWSSFIQLKPFKKSWTWIVKRTFDFEVGGFKIDGSVNHWRWIFVSLKKYASYGLFKISDIKCRR